MKLFGLLVFLSSSVAVAVTAEQVLKTAWTDKTYLSYDEIQATDSKNPLRNVEGFVGHEQNGTEATEIGVKFQLKSWPEWTRGRGKTEEQKLLKNTSLGWALQTRYNALLLFELTQQKLKCVEDAVSLSERYVKAQSLSLRAGRGTSKAFLSAKSDLYRFQRVQSTLTQERDLLLRRILNWVPDAKEKKVESMDLIQVEDISTALQEHFHDGDSLSKKIIHEEIEQMGQELAIVKGREQQWVKALELSQKKKKDADAQYEVELVIQIPILGSDVLAKQKQNELILKRALKQKELEESGDQLQNLRTQILNLIEIYRSAKKMERITVGTLDSLTNMDRKIAQRQEQLDLLNQQQEITMLYLNYLLESETLTKNPDKNYIDKKQKEI
ncbi:hypothetical protein [Bdellovibrio sp. BCCA]|uniref:hypothetical protein n=1 Tax=Bdellovibrio sp. BCCA TaxID=3136281 RepID=UPI0030F17FD7